MQSASLAAAAFAAACLCAGCSPAPPPDDGPTPPVDRTSTDPQGLLKVIGKLPAMAHPVVLLLRAIKDRNPELLKQVFSSRVRALPDFKRRSWQESVAYYDRVYREMFGLWEVSDFKFHGTTQREGQPNAGAVIVSFEPAGKEPVWMKFEVLREGGRWYVDER